eukprot:6780254-Pyramimonas_sp.AAC.1
MSVANARTNPPAALAEPIKADEGSCQPSRNPGAFLPGGPELALVKNTYTSALRDNEGRKRLGVPH